MQMIIVNIVLAFKILSKNTNSHYKHKYCSIFKYSVDKKWMIILGMQKFYNGFLHVRYFSQSILPNALMPVHDIQDLYCLFMISKPIVSVHHIQTHSLCASHPNPQFLCITPKPI